jgi:mono/diheme cytochrome c family protein
MEILRDLRSQRRGLTRSVAPSLLICGAAVALGCGKQTDRTSATADSVVLHSAGRADSGQTYKVTPPPDLSGVVTKPATPEFPDPVSILVADSVTGLRAYRRAGSCIACHGARAEGVAGLGSALADSSWKFGSGSLAFIYSVVRDGLLDSTAARVLMPGSGSMLSDRETFQVAAYVYSISHMGSTVPDSYTPGTGAPPVARMPPDTTEWQ